MRFPVEYLALVAVSALDILFTTLILALGGREVNPIADWILTVAGLPGIVLFKFAAVALVVCICEYIARPRPVTARRLARLAVAISAVPVVLALVQLFAYFVILGPDGGAVA